MEHISTPLQKLSRQMQAHRDRSHLYSFVADAKAYHSRLHNYYSFEDCLSGCCIQARRIESEPGGDVPSVPYSAQTRDAQRAERQAQSMTVPMFEMPGSTP